MDDAFDVVRRDHALDQVLVGGIADEQRHAFGQEGGKAGGQVVDHDDAFAGFHQRMNHVTSDIAGAAGDKHGHELTHLLDYFGRCYPARGEEWVSAQAELATMLNVAYRKCAKRSLTCRSRTIPPMICS